MALKATRILSEEINSWEKTTMFVVEIHSDMKVPGYSDLFIVSYFPKHMFQPFSLISKPTPLLCAPPTCRFLRRLPQTFYLKLPQFYTIKISWFFFFSFFILRKKCSPMLPYCAFYVIFSASARTLVLLTSVFNGLLPACRTGCERILQIL